MTGDLPEPQTPSVAELLERIKKLEAKCSRQDALCLKLATQIGTLIQQFGILDMHVIEIADKTFPGYRETQRQIWEICGPVPQKD